ncbi:GNAT family N-acetyltransferase [Streptomyces sp. NPDC005576]|uniref:GNAT family N-acetyltransferase n=1 Tax=Streptomyces sp. NPDC005576 TaxID=3364726 RepID=UPI003693967C
MDEPVMQEYDISADPALLDPARIHRRLSADAYWALGRSRATVHAAIAAIAASLKFFVCERSSGTQVGYARVVTDHVTFARLCDVYVDSAARDRGIGVRLAETVRDHLAPSGFRRILLATGDAHGAYEKAGCRGPEGPGRWMALINP